MKLAAYTRRRFAVATVASLSAVLVTTNVWAESEPIPYMAEDVGGETEEGPGSNGECPAGTELVCETNRTFEGAVANTTHADGITWTSDLDKYYRDYLKRKGEEKSVYKSFDFDGKVCRCAEKPVVCPTSFGDMDKDLIYGEVSPEKAASLDQKNWYKLHCFLNPFADSSTEKSILAGFFHDYGSESHFYNWVGNLVFELGEQYKDFACLCGVYRGNGCFAPEAELAMADGSIKRADQVAVGDRLRNPRNGEAMTVLKVVEGAEDKPMLQLGFDQTVTTVTSNHPVLTEAGLKPARMLRIGDKVFGADGEPRALTVLRERPVREGQYVINFITNPTSSDAGDHLLLGDGIVSGDLVIQNELAKQEK